jgi:DNA-binding protein HU-beta
VNKQELVKSISKKASITNIESEAVLKAFVGAIKETLKKGDKIQLVGFGSFTTVKRAARKGVNPKTKKAINIPAKKVAKFVPGKELKDLVNKAK